jgi:hypothetical protein
MPKGSGSGATVSPFVELTAERFCDPSSSDGNAHAEPILECRQVFLEHVLTKAIERELPFPPRFDQSRPGQLLEMVRHRRLRDGKLLAEALTAHLSAVCDLLENLEPPGIGERLGNAGEAFGIVRHRIYR